MDRPTAVNSAIRHLHSHRDQYLSDLKELLRIPSISTDPRHDNDIRSAAEWLQTYLRAMNAQNVEILDTPGKPVVTGDIPAAPDHVETAPTILLYAHYDVQPPDPVDLWESEPFEPTLRDNKLYARGSSDMKGQLMAMLGPIRSIQATSGLPVNIRILFEGEEEVGSPNLLPFIQAHPDLVAADLCLNPDTGMLGAAMPTITYALRGLAYYELWITGPATDLHSGIYGGAVHNPAQVLTEVVAAMHDVDGRVTLPGFYDNVRPMTDEERTQLARLPLTREHYLNSSGAPELFGEAGFTPVERVGARPTLEINGLYSGYIGEGSKTVLPSKAMAKISMRLVPDQDHRETERQLRKFIEDRIPDSVRFDLKKMTSGPPFLSPLDSAGNQALAEALQAVWGAEPAFKREGGSVPVATYLQEVAGVPSVLTGFGLPDDALHAPNEKVDVPTLYNGMDALVHFFFTVPDYR